MKMLLTPILFASLFLAPPAPTAPGLVALTNARIVTVTAGVIEGATLVMDQDRIVALGADIAIPYGARVIDCSGLSIYPGLIDSGTQMGLIEVGSLAETRDASELGDLSPQMKALTAVNPNAVAIAVTRVSGVTTVLTEPSGGMLPGQSALINLHGYTPTQMFAGFEGVALEFPATGRRGRFDGRSDEAVDKASKAAFKKLNDAWEGARLYHRIDSAAGADPTGGRRPEYVPSIAALLPVIRGEQALIVRVNVARDIEAAIEWVERHRLPRVIFSGLAEGWRVADKIAAARIPCLVGPVLSVPTRDSDRFDKAYANAGLMRDAGVVVALRSGETANARNLPYNAGFAAAYGMGTEEALRAVTIVPAEVFGLTEDLGSLEVGKKATLFVTNGDPFETSTDVYHVFIDGYQIPMTSRHTKLYEEFLQRTPGIDKYD